MSEIEKPTVGITTTIPVEVLLSCGMRPIDLNNLFISSPSRLELIEKAHRAGFPQNTCAWLKGIYGAVVSQGFPQVVVGVVRGDCSGTQILLEALSLAGIRVIPFSYPYPPSREELRREIEKLAESVGTNLESSELIMEELRPVRDALREIDRLLWEDNEVSGLEAHKYLVSSSDFGGNPVVFLRELEEFLTKAHERKPLNEKKGIQWKREIRLGYVGVPPVVPDIFEIVEEMGARFVFHEVQRQFAMLGSYDDLVSMYLDYTYPYDLMARVSDINRESRARQIDGIIHYVQSFCHRNLEDVIFSRKLEKPMLTVECDCPGELGASALSRIESFIQVLGENL
ncbi:MAG: 2-hydroxyacyl-CoA dehydratase family protein [Actinomycetota bacterium]|nr:2-hydroxyacyl-CoA dehydratase family protein [Actinomycetota bacterium]